MGIIDEAVSWAVNTAKDDSYYYLWGGWGPKGYDCGHFVIAAYEQAGLKIRAAGATYTGDMRDAFLQCGFKDVTSSVNCATGEGIKRGDVLIDADSHAAMMQTDGKTTVEALGKRAGIVCDYPYRNHPWDYVLRYAGANALNGTSKLKPQREQVITVPAGLGKYYTYERWDRSDWIYNQKKLCDFSQSRNDRSYDSDGFGKIGNRFVIAMTSTFGAIGDYVDVYCSDGRVINAVIGDEKDQTTAHGTPANKWGHENGQNIVEWMTNRKLEDNPKSNGGIVKVINLGNYFEYPEYARGEETYYYDGENQYGESEATVVWNARVSENIHPVLTAQNTITPPTGFCIYANDADITRYAGDLEWQNTVGQLAATLSFSIPKTDAKYLTDKLYTPVIGDVVKMFSGDEKYRGMITEIDDGDRNVNKYSVKDLGWWLNKSKQTYQFKNIRADDAIKTICADLQLNVVKMPELTVNINMIYFDKAISDILNDILEHCGSNYMFDMVPEGIRIYVIGDECVQPTFRLAPNIAPASSADYISDRSHSLSMENLINSVKITSEKDSVYKEIMVKQDRESINKFGFLQEIVKIDEEKDNAQTIAENTMSEHNSMTESCSCRIIEDVESYTRAGMRIEIDGISYNIMGTSHSISGGVHYVKLDLERRTV